MHTRGMHVMRKHVRSWPTHRLGPTAGSVPILRQPRTDDPREFARPACAEQLMTARTFMLFAALSVLAAIEQLLAVRWGIFGASAGSLLCGGIVLIGWRAFAPEIDHDYLLPLFAVAASLLGLWSAIAGTAMSYTPLIWLLAVIAALPTGIHVLWIRMRASRCHLCHASLRRLLSFSCPRCALIACENCWEFERGRCHLCAANQVPLFPIDPAWWHKRFGRQVYDGKCALCLQAPESRVAHWACPACGHTQCRLCWDDNNGQCSRCAWSIASVPGASTDSPPDAHQQSRHPSYESEVYRAEVSDTFRYSPRGEEVQRRHRRTGNA